MSKTIFLTLLNGTGYVFDLEDYMELRREHRIVGTLVGMSASNEKVLPAELSALETRLLIDEGIAKLVSKAENLLRAPTAEETIMFEQAAEARIAAQAEALKAERLCDAERNMERILDGKRKKLLLAGKSIDEVTKEKVLQEISEKFVFEKQNAFIEITCAYAEKHAAYIVPLPPMNPSDTLKYRVFRNYWKAGKYVTPGDAFGGDFLIYPGDPMCYHASHVVIVAEKPTNAQLLTIIKSVRLSIAVNKISVIVFTSEDATDETIHYITLEWDSSIDRDDTAEASPPDS